MTTATVRLTLSLLAVPLLTLMAAPACTDHNARSGPFSLGGGSLPSPEGTLEEQVDTLIEEAIATRAFPGAAVAIGRAQEITLMKGYGTFTYMTSPPVTPHSLFDLASVTKVVATTTAAMQLYEAGRLDLYAPVALYLPEFGRNGKEVITIYHLMAHTSGLIPYRAFHTMGVTRRQEVLDYIMADTLFYAPGTRMRYSDYNMILLAQVIEAISGQAFAAYAEEHIFEPLGMTSTGFRKAGSGVDRTVVPTEFDRHFRRRLIQGEVHDETAFILGGTAGHAGLFSTAEDLSKFAQMMLNGGMVDGKPFLQPSTIRKFTTRIAFRGNHSRALGWDTQPPVGRSSAGHFFGPHSFGHTGFTGTSLWIDPEADLFVVLLTNRVYPTRNNQRLGPVRPALADMAYRELVRAAPPMLSAQ